METDGFGRVQRDLTRTLNSGSECFVDEPPVILGLWPIAGITTLGVTEADALATIHAAIDAGIRRFDTAFSYGYEGESDRLLGQVLRERQVDTYVIGKVGQRWDGTERVVDGRPATLIADAETSLTRMRRTHFDCLMLHSPDPNVPIEESAQAMADLQRRQLCRTVGFCNMSLEQLDRFASVVPCHAIQCPLNLIQFETQQPLVTSARERGTNVFTFWALMKGLLAGMIKCESEMDPSDPRLRYEIFRGESRRRADQVVAGLREIGEATNQTVPQLAIGWVLAQPGVTSVLAGARRPEQVNAWASSRALASETCDAIDALVGRVNA